MKRSWRTCCDWFGFAQTAWRLAMVTATTMARVTATPTGHRSYNRHDRAWHLGDQMVIRDPLAITAALQIVVVFVSGSVALLADTIHNVADATTAIPLWIAFLLARRKPTETFTYGYGRVEDFAGITIVAHHPVQRVRRWLRSY